MYALRTKSAIIDVQKRSGLRSCVLVAETVHGSDGLDRLGATLEMAGANGMVQLGRYPDSVAVAHTM